MTRFLSENHGKSVVQLGHVTARVRRNVNSCRLQVPRSGVRGLRNGQLAESDPPAGLLIAFNCMGCLYSAQVPSVLQREAHVRSAVLL